MSSNSDCQAGNSDISGIGIRSSFYIQNFVLVLLVNRSWEDAPGALWTFIMTSFGLMIAAIAGTTHSNSQSAQPLTFFEAIQVSNLVWLANFGTFIALASYSRQKEEKNYRENKQHRNHGVPSTQYVKLAAVCQTTMSIGLTLVMWSIPERLFGQECTDQVKFIAFGATMNALTTGRRVGLALTILVSSGYFAITAHELLNSKAWKRFKQNLRDFTWPRKLHSAVVPGGAVTAEPENIGIQVQHASEGESDLERVPSANPSEASSFTPTRASSSAAAAPLSSPPAASLSPWSAPAPSTGQSNDLRPRSSSQSLHPQTHARRGSRSSTQDSKSPSSHRHRRKRPDPITPVSPSTHLAPSPYTRTPSPRTPFSLINARPRRRWIHKVDKLLFGSIVAQVVTFGYFIAVNEAYIHINESPDGRQTDTQWGFGQIFALIVVLPSAVSLITAFRVHGVKNFDRREEERRQNNPMGVLPKRKKRKYRRPSETQNKPVVTIESVSSFEAPRSLV